MFEWIYAIRLWWYFAREKRRTRKDRLDGPLIDYIRYLWS